ncbi:uncharacterized protein ACR2FA_010438 [Aphomia sociella]
MLATIFCSILNAVIVFTPPLYIGYTRGPGKWSLEVIEVCPDYPSNLHLTRTKLNSTADCFSGTIKLPKGIHDSNSIGFKFTRLESTPPLTRYLSQSYRPFIYKYTKYSDKGQCHVASETYPFIHPLPPGDYTFDNFVYHYVDDELPTIGAYGTYDVTVHLYNKCHKIVGCLRLLIAFSK